MSSHPEVPAERPLTVQLSVTLTPEAVTQLRARLWAAPDPTLAADLRRITDSVLFPTGLIDALNSAAP
jgi:hypothetical protein